MVQRGLALADAEGLDAVTVRRLAAELGVTPMALYWHFRSKDDLLAGLADSVWAEIDVNVDPAAEWQDSCGCCSRPWSGCCACTRGPPPC